MFLKQTPAPFCDSEPLPTTEKRRRPAEGREQHRF
jgi:hypothetical protein